MFVIQQGKEKSMGRKSTRENKTIYQQLREEDNLPREKASELLAFISEDRLERIENEKVQPAPEDVIRMSQVYNAPELCNYYCSHECPIGMKYVPSIEMTELPAIILETVASLNAVYPPPTALSKFPEMERSPRTRFLIFPISRKIWKKFPVLLKHCSCG